MNVLDVIVLVKEENYVRDVIKKNGEKGLPEKNAQLMDVIDLLMVRDYV